MIKIDLVGSVLISIGLMGGLHGIRGALDCRAQYNAAPAEVKQFIDSGQPESAAEDPCFMQQVEEVKSLTPKAIGYGALGLASVLPFAGYVYHQRRRRFS
jgi:hypothetical protein